MNPAGMAEYQMPEGTMKEMKAALLSVRGGA